MGNIVFGVKQGLCGFSQMSPFGNKRRRHQSAPAEGKKESISQDHGTKKRSVVYDEERSVPTAERAIELFQVCKEGCRINNRYEVIDKLGAGSFGLVLKVRDTISDRLLALKISKDLHPAQDILKEADILKKLKKLDRMNQHHIVRIMDEFLWNKRYCFTVELLRMNLAQYLFRYNPDGLRIDETKIIVYQLLETLEFLADRRLIHCDLKPPNIMLKDLRTLEIKVIDFGSSEVPEALTNVSYFQTRFYRAPEVILGAPVTPAIDIWSLGCIMAELHTGKILFEGLDEEDQINEIVLALGMPPTSVLRQGVFTSKFFDTVPQGRRNSYSAKSMERKGCGEPGSKPVVRTILRASCTRQNSEGKYSSAKVNEKWILDLILQMLEYDATRRVTASKAKKHLLFHPQNKVKKGEERTTRGSRPEYFRR